MNLIITILQIVVSILLIGFIFIQSHGGGLGSTFGGSGFYSSKRGVEKVVLNITIVLTLLFFVTSILNFIV
ncbi:preprotein translocase subunit SecG [Patescibacteria group bacterium]